MTRETSDLHLSTQLKKDKVLAWAPPPALHLTRDGIDLPTNWQAQLCAYDQSNQLSSQLNRFIGKAADEKSKGNLTNLTTMLTLIFYRLDNQLQLGPLLDEQKTAIITNLTEKLAECNPSDFHKRANRIVLDMGNPPWIKTLCGFDATGKLTQFLLKQHIGVDSTYTYKADLISTLILVFYRLNGQFDSQLGLLSDDEKSMILSKLTEDIEHCTPGFHDRVTEIVLSMSQPQNFAQLLQVVRENLVIKTAAQLTKEVHATNTIINKANVAGYGVRPRNQTDSYVGIITDTKIFESLSQTFQQELTPFHLVSLLEDALRGVLSGVYTGKKEGYATDAVKKMLGVIQQFLFTEEEKKQLAEAIEDFEERPLIEQASLNHPQDIHRKKYFQTEPIVPGDEDMGYNFLDLNWIAIRKKIFEKLKRENYFAKSDVIRETILDLSAYDAVFPDKSDDQKCLTINTLITKLLENKQMDAQLPHLTEFYEKATPACRDAFFKHEKFIEFIENTSTASFSKWPNCLIQTMSVQTIIRVFLRLETPYIRFNQGDILRYVQIFLRLKTHPSIQFQNQVDALVYFQMIFESMQKQSADPNANQCYMLNILINKMQDYEINGLILWLNDSSANINRMSALIQWLYCTAAKDDSDAVKAISNAFVKLIEKTENTRALIDGLCKQKTSDPDSGTNGFYRLMRALNWAVKKDNRDAVKAISNAFVTLIQKTENTDALIDGLCKQKTSDPDSGTNGFYLLMDALNWAAVKDNLGAVTAISNAFVTLIQKTENTCALIGGLSKQRPSDPGFGINGFYWLMHTLGWAVEKDNRDVVKAISNAFVKLIEQKTNTRALIDGLSKQEKSSSVSGFYWLIIALHQAAAKDNRDAVKAISDAFVKLIGETENTGALIDGLSKQRISDPGFGINGFYWLMEALNQAVQNHDAVKAISDAMVKLIDQTKDTGALIDGLSKQEKSSRVSGFYWLMSALNWAVKKDNHDAVEAISDAMVKLIEKTKDTGALIDGLSKQKTSDPDPRTNGFYWLMDALSLTASRLLLKRYRMHLLH